MGIGAGFSQRDLVGWSAQDFDKSTERNARADGRETRSLPATLADLVDLTENYETHYKAIFEAR